MEGPISSVSTPDLIDQITELAGHLNAAQARWLALIAEFDRRKDWTGEAFDEAQAVDWLLQHAERAKNVSAEMSADP